MPLSSIDVEGIGPLSHKGVSRFWTGEVRLVGEVEPVELTIRGTPEGPTPRQVDAIRAMLANSETLKPDATAGLRALLALDDMETRNVWDVFEVSDVHVPHESYDPAAIHVLITVEHVDHPDEFRPAIDVSGGVVVNVLGGT